jgi:hypothetical protein
MGKQMVKDYVHEHSEISVEQLMDIPAQEILKEYKPG